MVKAKDDLLDAIDKSPSLKARSLLSVWMRENHDGFAARLSERLADWSVLCAMFKDAGLTDRYGNPPKPEAARKTWRRVRAEVAASRARKPSPASGPMPRTPPPTTQSNPVAATETAPSDDILRVMQEMGARSGQLPEPLKR